MKARKKPVIVNVFKVGGEAPQWFLEAYRKGKIFYRAIDGKLIIKTLEGDMIANKDDWIIKGVNGEIYPCKPDIFEKTYEILERQSNEK